jgi:hypothetical protein
MRRETAVFVGSLSLVIAGCSRQGTPFSEPLNPTPSPEVVALNQQFPLYGASRRTLAVARPRDDLAPATEAARELRVYYADGKKEPAWKDAVRLLSAEDGDKRTAASTYLTDLLDQALKDEEAGVSPWEASPFWDGGGTNPARSVRERIAATLAETPPTPGTLPVVKWFLEHEKLTRLQAQALRAVTGLQGHDANALLLNLALRPHPNIEVACAALAQIDERKLEVTAEQLAPLCQHHRTRLRTAARALNEHRGFSAPAAFDPVRAIQAEPLHKFLLEVGSLLAEPIPIDAPLVVVNVKGPNNTPVPVHGWLLEENEERWVLLTPNGRRSTFLKKDKHETAPAITQLSIQGEVDRVARLRRKDKPDFELTQQLVFAGQPEGNTADGHASSEHEALLAQWLFAGKHYEQAAAILLPALDAFLLDSHLVDITRDRLGDWYGHEMLAAFIGDRDYAKAEQVAKWIVERFPRTQFHADATRFLEELPRRRDDFDALRLPTPEEWAKQKEGMTRREQIDSLCRRVRLVNAFQAGQPGGIWYGEAQYAEPCGINTDASFGLRQGKTVVINPLVELAGPIPGGGVYWRSAKSEGMELTVADIPALAEHLREDWFVLAVSFHRSFTPSRTLHHTRPLVASLINRLARRRLCRSESIDVMTEIQRGEEIARLVQWAHANQNKKERELLRGAVEDALKSGDYFSNVLEQTIRLADMKEEAIIPLAFRFVEAGLAQGYLEHIRVQCNKINPGALDRLAREAFSDKDLKVRMNVALLALPTADRAAALAVLGDGLENGEYLLVETVSTLVGHKAADGRITAVRVFKNRRLPALDVSVRRMVVAYATSAGLPDGLRFYLRLLETPGSAISGTRYDRPVAEIAAEEVMDSFAHQDRVVDEIKKKPTPTSEKVVDIQAWVREKIEKMEDGK